MSGQQITLWAKSGNAEVQDYLRSLLNSRRFQKANVLRHLLQYLLSRTAEGRINEIKESVIAIDVFGRPPEFDGRLDNIVRVQAHRLRKLLESYYEAEGARDSYHVSLPKGSYVPLVHKRNEVLAEPEPTCTLPGEESVKSNAAPPANWQEAARRKYFTFIGLALAMIAAIALGAVSVLLIGPRLGLAPLGGAASSAGGLRAEPLVELWGSLLSPSTPVVISFTNPAFLWAQAGAAQIYMTYRGPLSAPVGSRIDLSTHDPYVDQDLIRNHGPFYFSDSWTGIGEVLAASRLTALFSEAGKPVKVLRSRSVTSNDLREANLIFLGSTWANELQEKLNAEATPLVCYGRERIVNRQPRSGEPVEFAPAYDSATRELLSDYVLFSVLPGITPGTKIMASAGIQTRGTYAAIEYLTSTTGVSELIRHFDPTGRKKLPGYFQAVIRHEMIRGEPVKESLVLVRELGNVALHEGPHERSNPVRRPGSAANGQSQGHGPR
jgi:hypothetical protein